MDRSDKRQRAIRRCAGLREVWELLMNVSSVASKTSRMSARSKVFWLGSSFSTPLKDSAACLALSGQWPPAMSAMAKRCSFMGDGIRMINIRHNHTITAIKAFQEKSGLPVTGTLDSTTLAQ